MNEQYLNQTIRRLVYLESLKQSEINNLSAHLKEIDKLIKELMLDDEMTELTLAEFNKVMTQVKTGVAASLSSCLLYTSPSPRDGLLSRMPSSA